MRPLNECLEEGQAAEQLAGEYLAKRFGYHFYPYKADGPFKPFDYILQSKADPAKVYLVEHKEHAKPTGNLFLEFSCNGEDSGLKATRAQIWSNTVPHLNLLITFPPNRMLKYCRNKRVISGGDGNRVRGYLVEIEELRNLNWVNFYNL